MKKLFLTMAASMLMTGAFADALYWLIDQQPEGGVQFDYAALRVADSATKTKVDGAYLCTVRAATSPGLQTGLGVADLGVYGNSDYSFYVELYDSAAKSVGVTDFYDYSTLLGAGYVAPSGIEPGGNATWVVTEKMISVPEPTSALLLLMGLAPLALRRKQDN